MLKIYREELLLRTCNCDMQGRWRPSAILETMQETAGTHAHLLGCGRDRLLEDNIIWVISRSEVQMQRHPVIGERVRIETFPMQGRRFFFPRFFIFRDEQDNQIGCAGTLWVLLDLTTRRMATSEAVAAMLPENADLTPPLALPRAVPRPADGAERVLTRLPVYTDLDINGHVNNTRYADWLCDALGVDVLRQNDLSSLHINYTAEVLPDRELTLCLLQSGEQYYLSGNHGDKQHFEIGGTLIARGLRDS